MSASHPNLELKNEIFDSHPFMQHHSHHFLNQSPKESSHNNDVISNFNVVTSYKEANVDRVKKQERSKIPNGQKINRSVSCGRSTGLKTHVDEININNNNNNKLSNNSIKSKDTHSIVGDFSSEIDSALAEVMSNIHYLGVKHGVTSLEDIKKHTPDLVIDLPLSSSSSLAPIQHLKSSIASSLSSSSSESPNSSHLTNAEVFANVDQSTIKKGKTFEKQASFITPTTSSKLISSHVTSPVISRQQTLPSKKYATLGRNDNKNKLNEFFEHADVERNSFGKPKQLPTKTMFPSPNTSPNPPTRTSSRLTGSESPQHIIRIESTALPSSVLAKAPKLDPTVNQPMTAPTFSLIHNNYFNNDNVSPNSSLSNASRTSHILPSNSQLSPNLSKKLNNEKVNNNVKFSYGKSKISAFEIPKLKVASDGRDFEGEDVAFVQSQRHSYPVQSPTKPTELQPHRHPHHYHHSPFSFKPAAPAPTLPTTQNPSYNPMLEKPKTKPPLMKKPPKSIELMRRMTVDSTTCGFNSFKAFKEESFNNTNNAESNSQKSNFSSESIEEKNPLYISKDL